MQFSDTTDKQGILEDVRDLTLTNSTSYTTAAIVRSVNKWAYRVVTWIYEASSTFQFDDTNLTTHPIVTATLVAGQADYQLPTDLLKLERVSVKDSNGNYHVLRPIDIATITEDLDEFMETDGMPIYYDLIGGSLFLYPAPAASSVTTSEGLKIHFLREVDVFSASDTTQQPGFVEPFHQILSYGAAYDFFVQHGDRERAQSTRTEIEALKQDLQGFYSARNREVKVKAIPHHVRNRTRNIV